MRVSVRGEKGVVSSAQVCTYMRDAATCRPTRPCPSLPRQSQADPRERRRRLACDAARSSATPCEHSCLLPRWTHSGVGGFYRGMSGGRGVAGATKNQHEGLNQRDALSMCLHRTRCPGNGSGQSYASPGLSSPDGPRACAGSAARAVCRLRACLASHSQDRLAGAA